MSAFDQARRIEDALGARDAEERMRALRALLATPELSAERDPDLFRLTRRHADHLREWFERELGWRLLVEPRTIRLRMSYVPRGPTATAIAERHPARVRRTDPPFTRRRYVLLCLVLATLERSDPQVALGRLTDDVLLAARQGGLEDIEFTLRTREERSDLVAVIRLLMAHGVLQRVAGDEDAYVSADGDALYDVDRRVLSTILAVRHSPATVALAPGAEDTGAGEAPAVPSISRIEAALDAPPTAFTEDETNRQTRHSLARRLLMDPVTYFDELDDRERAYLVSQRTHLTRRLSESTGLVAEIRAEGIALVDPDDQLTDLRMPEQGTEGHATLLVAEHLATDGAATVADLRRHVRAFAQEYSAYWRRSSREPGAENALVSGVLDRLVGLGLVRVAGRGPEAQVLPLPALARFTVAEPTIRERPQP